MLSNPRTVARLEETTLVQLLAAVSENELSYMLVVEVGRVVVELPVFGGFGPVNVTPLYYN
jgi:hypothetical protein